MSHSLFVEEVPRQNALAHTSLDVAEQRLRALTRRGDGRGGGGTRRAIGPPWKPSERALSAASPACIGHGVR